MTPISINYEPIISSFEKSHFFGLIFMMIFCDVEYSQRLLSSALNCLLRNASASFVLVVILKCSGIIPAFLGFLNSFVFHGVCNFIICPPQILVVLDEDDVVA